ncbi:MAG: hypothetical protein QME51_04005, partial [Planctomycetota bacterium]|nr:hypothetical protein [Planctomycetota bacterium]
MSTKISKILTLSNESRTRITRLARSALSPRLRPSLALARRGGRGGAGAGARRASWVLGYPDAMSLGKNKVRYVVPYPSEHTPPVGILNTKM